MERAVAGETISTRAGGMLRRDALARMWASSLTADLLIVCGMSLVLGLIRLGAPSLWIDEALTAHEIRESFFAYSEGYYWLYYSIERPWTILVGTSEWALRFPSVVGAMASGALLVLLGRRLFDRWIALISAILLVSSPFFVRWSQQARGYTLMVAVSLVATIVLLRALERGTRKDWALYGLAFSAVVVWHPVSGLLLAAPHAVLAYQRRERVLPHGLLAAIVICAVAVPWAAQIAMRSSGEGAAINWLTYPTLDVAARALFDVSGAAGFGVALGVVGLWVLRRTGATADAAWLGVWAVSPFVVTLLVSIVKPVFLDRYLLVASPAFALLAGVALVRSARWLRLALVVALVAATSVGLVHWYSTADGGNWHGEDWRGAVTTVLERRSDAESVVVAEWAAFPAAEYYGVRVSDTSTAEAIWVLRWSEEGRNLSVDQRASLGFGQHRLVESIPFGERLSLQLWRR